MPGLSNSRPGSWAFAPLSPLWSLLEGSFLFSPFKTKKIPPEASPAKAKLRFVSRMKLDKLGLRGKPSSILGGLFQLQAIFARLAASI